MMLLFIAITAVMPLADAAANMTPKKQPPVNVKRQGVTLEVSTTIDVLGLPVPLDLVVITNNNTLSSVVTNLLGIAPPLDVSVGDVITIHVPGSSQPATFVIPAEADEAEWSVNIKRGILSLLQVNVEADIKY